MKTEVETGLEVLRANGSRGKVIVSANLGCYSVYVTFFAPKNEQEGLLAKVYSLEPFKGKEQLYSLDVADLPFWSCRLNKFSAQIIS